MNLLVQERIRTHAAYRAGTADAMTEVELLELSLEDLLVWMKSIRDEGKTLALTVDGCTFTLRCSNQVGIITHEAEILCEEDDIGALKQALESSGTCVEQ